MKKSTKFWYSALILVVGVLIFNYLTIFTKFVLTILTIVILLVFILYAILALACIIISLIDGSMLDDETAPKTHFIYLVGAKYNIFYFLFYTCIVKFNSWLDSL